MQTGNHQQIWWCGMGRNPEKPSQDSDAILYVDIDTTTGRKTDPIVVLAETPGAWDSVFTCNPRVVRGSFVNPLGDGATYTYAMYYVATNVPQGTFNNIGVAFSNDGIQWSKYKDPVILSGPGSGYGVGQPVVYNVDSRSNLVLFYEDSTAGVEHLKTTTTDGVHFTVQGTLTRKGLEPNHPAPSWGDIGYDPVTKYWYAVFNLGVRDHATTGGKAEIGQYGIEMYRIPDASLLSGLTPWEMVTTFDTNGTGYEAIFLAGFLKDQYGNLNVGSYPKIQLFPSIANPKPGWNDAPKTLGKTGDIYQWDIGSVVWTPSDAQLTLTRYKNHASYNTTTGYLDPPAHFVADSTIGHLYQGLKGGATIPFFSCKSGAKDFFVSLDQNCDGSYIVGLEGYGYARPPAGQRTVAVYSCLSARQGHFVSGDSQCEGAGAGTLLGYALP